MNKQDFPFWMDGESFPTSKAPTKKNPLSGLAAPKVHLLILNKIFKL